MCYSRHFNSKWQKMINNFDLENKVVPCHTDFDLDNKILPYCSHSTNFDNINKIWVENILALNTVLTMFIFLQSGVIQLPFFILKCLSYTKSFTFSLYKMKSWKYFTRLLTLSTIMFCFILYAPNVLGLRSNFKIHENVSCIICLWPNKSFHSRFLLFSYSVWNASLSHNL